MVEYLKSSETIKLRKKVQERASILAALTFERTSLMLLKFAYKVASPLKAIPVDDERCWEQMEHTK